jgi:hypothetical protein
MEAIQGETNLSKTECGHTFHFQCLYRWHRRHTTCPLCRKDFGGFEEETEQRVADYTLRMLMVSATRLDTHQIVRRHYAELPIEEFTGEIEQRDIDLVAGQAGVDHSLAQTYLRYYHGDIVDAILCLTEHAQFPIPPFRRRIRSTEPYETRTVRDRLIQSRRKEAKSGYEST